MDYASSIDEFLQRVRMELEQLPRLVAILDSEPADVRDLWHWQWEEILERMVSIGQNRQQGLLSAAQQEESLVVWRQLADSRHLVEALGCSLPLGPDIAMSEVY